MLARIEEAIEDYKAGKFLIVVDDEDRENEGDLIIAAEKVDASAVNFMAKEACGLVCIALTSERLERLGLEQMVRENTALHDTAFTVSVDAKKGVTTGISATDRARTISVLLDDNTRPEDLARPGHIFPLEARKGGVLKRAGHTEATIELARLSGLKLAGVLCEIMAENGEMSRGAELEKFAKKHNLKILSIQDLIAYRLRSDSLVKRRVESRLPTKWGDFKIILYENELDNKEHIALVKGSLDVSKPILTRVHSECFTGDTLSSLRCDCGEQLHTAMRNVEKEGAGVILYMRQEGRGIGLANKLEAYNLQDEGQDTVEANKSLGFAADLRNYGIGAQILLDLGVKEIRLMTNNPKKVVGLEGYGLKIVEIVPLEVGLNPHNLSYMQTKKEKMGHKLNLNDN